MELDEAKVEQKIVVRAEIMEMRHCMCLGGFDLVSLLESLALYLHHCC